MVEQAKEETKAPAEVPEMQTQESQEGAGRGRGGGRGRRGGPPSARGRGGRGGARGGGVVPIDQMFSSIKQRHEQKFGPASRTLSE